VPDRAIDDDEIEPAVVVVVQEPGAEAREAKLEESELGRAVLE